MVTRGAVAFLVLAVVGAAGCGGDKREPTADVPTRAEVAPEPIAVIPDSHARGTDQEDRGPADTYESPLTGEVHFAAWSDESGGLQCRLGTTASRYNLGGPAPILLLQVRNTSDHLIRAPDLFQQSMLVMGCPIQATVYGEDFQWIFDHDRLRRPLLPGETIEAACRLQRRLFPRAGEAQLHVALSRGVSGGLLRPAAWWSGTMRTPPLLLVGHHGQ